MFDVVAANGAGGIPGIAGLATDEVLKASIEFEFEFEGHAPIVVVGTLLGMGMGISIEELKLIDTILGVI